VKLNFISYIERLKILAKSNCPYLSLWFKTLSIISLMYFKPWTIIQIKPFFYENNLLYICYSTLNWIIIVSKQIFQKNNYWIFWSKINNSQTWANNRLWITATYLQRPPFWRPYWFFYNISYLWIRATHQQRPQFWWSQGW
jgi:hypothetical protein